MVQIREGTSITGTIPSAASSLLLLACFHRRAKTLSVNTSNQGMLPLVTATLRSGVAEASVWRVHLVRSPNYNKGLAQVPGSPLGARGMA